MNKMRQTNKKRVTQTIIGLCLTMGILSCASSGINKGQFNMISLSQEIEMGKAYAKQLDEELEKQGKKEKMILLQEYIDKLGQRIARNSDLSNLSYHFEVIESDQINAFALPGGYIYVYRGLIEAAENEAQLASVLAHEIGHVAARHATERISLMQGADLVGSILFAIIGVPPVWQQQVIQVAELLGFLAYTRSQESEADALGFQYMQKGGYNPQGMLDFFKVIQRKSEKEPFLLTKLFSSHPLTTDRITMVENKLRGYSLPDRPDPWKVNSSQFAIIKSFIAKD
jgi:beta-barrel assembly-enhancing protease